MRKQLVLALICFIGAGTLWFFFDHSQSRFASNHEEMLKHLIFAKQTDAVLEKDLLKSRSYLLQTYDPLVENSSDVEANCAKFRSSSLAIYHVLDPKLDSTIDAYCEASEKLTTDIEHFKSRNAVMRNSLYYIGRLATTLPNVSGSTDDGGIIRDLILASLAYFITATSDSLNSLKSAVAQAETIHHPSDELVSALAHSKKILESKEQLDLLTQQIMNSHADEMLDKLKTDYFESYSRAEAIADRYRRAVFVICTLLFFFAIYSVARLLRFARDLSGVNASLEQRVEDRTRELRQSQETILQQQQSIIVNAKTSALGEMAGQAAHEINTPLGAIILTSESLKNRVNENNYDQKYFTQQIDLILKVTQKVTRIISSMRKLAGHGGNDTISEVQLDTLIGDTVLLCEGRFKKVGILFEVKFLGVEKRKLQCVPSEISQVLINLLNNAHDAILSYPEKWIKLIVSECNGRVRFEVLDCGTIISEENKKKLFTPNFTTKSLNQGTGFGLSISRKIAERHRGLLHLDQAQMNTCFVLELPWGQEDTLARMVQVG